MSIPSWAYRGAKVVCVKNFPRAEVEGVNHPHVNSVYTIREIDPVPPGDCIRLAEVIGHICLDGHEASWGIECFRPLITQSDDISAHFQHHLSNPVREEA